MQSTITCFIPFSEEKATTEIISDLQKDELIAQIYVLGNTPNIWNNNVDVIPIDHLFSSNTMAIMAEHTHTPYLLFYTEPTAVKLNETALKYFYNAAEESQKGLIYSNLSIQTEKSVEPKPSIDYQAGSLREDFDFGTLILLHTDAFKHIQKQITTNYRYAGWYAIRLALIEKHGFFHIKQTLYTCKEIDNRASGEKQFDYVNPKNREVQIEMEQACTKYLKNIGALLPPIEKEIAIDHSNFEITASVIIPVYNREKTISDAIVSALNQQTSFKYNIIIVDNHSTDNTTSIIADMAAKNDKIVHIIPNANNLGIGGCWNEGIFHKACGLFAVQLDSDDLYSDENTLQQIIDTFYSEKCAMVIGSYRMVNFNQEEIPPGIIDHKEWTPENGHNNALRINGLGAPRAFYTPILRQNPLNNVSYGEDYAIGLCLSRSYKIGRIYDPIYLCRRWEENSDANLDYIKKGSHDSYKDTVRTIELMERIKLLKKTIS